MVLCAWLLLFGIFYNTVYIKSIQPSREDVYRQENILTERPCFPYFEREPCYNYRSKDIFERSDDLYLLTIANTESGGDYRFVPDIRIKISNTSHPIEYKRVKDFLEVCT